MIELNGMMLECPCCGDLGAVSDAKGLFWDGQPTWCGCDGGISCDAETDPWLNCTYCDCEGEGKIKGPEPAVYDPRDGTYQAADAWLWEIDQANRKDSTEDLRRTESK